MVIATQTPSKQWVVASETRPNVLYVVKQVGGYYSCDCAGHYRWSRCKHADAVRKAQPVPAADPAKVEMAKRLGLMAS
jgi:hypothetical protein